MVVRLFVSVFISMVLSVPAFGDDGFCETFYFNEWDQQPDPNGPVVLNQVFPDFDVFSTYLVTDVEVEFFAAIYSITAYFDDHEQAQWDQVEFAVLNVFLDDGALDSEDPTAGQVVPVTVSDSDGDGIWEVTANVFFKLQAGRHWVGLTPITNFANATLQQHTANSVVGMETFVRNPGGGFGIGTDWQPVSSAFGIVPVDIAIALLDIGPLSKSVDAAPTSLSVIRGIQVAGGLDSLGCTKDDDVLEMRPGIIFSAEPPVWLEIEHYVSRFDPATLKLNTQAGTPGLEATVEIFNFDTGQYENFGSFSAPFGKSALNTVNFPADASSYVNSVRKTRVRIGWRVAGLIFNYPWTVEIDRVVIFADEDC